MPRIETAERLKMALIRKKKRAQRRLIALQNGVPVDSDSDLSLEDNDQEEVSIFRPEKSFVRPIMLLYKGTARCVNNYYPRVQCVAKQLASGSLIGESDTLNCVGIDYFGDIYAEQDGLVCLVIERPDLSLGAFEIKLLREILGNQNTNAHMPTTKF